MTAWWNALSVLQQVLFVIACATTIFMIIQIITMLIGSGHEDGFDMDTNVDAETGDTFNDENVFSLFGLKIISIRTIVAFFCIGSWLMFTLCYVIHWGLALLFGILAGFAAALAIAFFMKAIEKLQNSGNLEIKSSVGKNGEVYLTIPADRKGTGKVNIFLQERYVELDAVTDNDEAIPTGSNVNIIGAINQGTVVVELNDKNAKLKREDK